MAPARAAVEKKPLSITRKHVRAYRFVFTRASTSYGQVARLSPRHMVKQGLRAILHFLSLNISFQWGELPIIPAHVPHMPFLVTFRIQNKIITEKKLGSGTAVPDRSTCSHISSTALSGPVLHWWR
ncbi:hypothetical protein Zmor_009271 [Zophobas morio]|uniref:Uncharacterized protein n=1 Tax=Zophobas morio TaxID=2755281 RepID=A0AA38MI71_9CUCU|nr:hypothetical protein Zmor_009271 [Zophobas morio]